MNAERPVIDRRTVVRTAVVTAWTVPVVQAVSAVPAFAATSGPADISATTGTVTFSNGLFGAKSYTVTVTIKNAGGSATAGLTATLNWTPKDKNAGTLLQLSSPTGTARWTRVRSAQSWTAGTQVPAGGQQSFKLTGTILRGSNAIACKLSVTFAASSKTAAVSGTI
jgi:hypothetical protein